MTKKLSKHEITVPGSFLRNKKNPKIADFAIFFSNFFCLIANKIRFAEHSQSVTSIKKLSQPEITVPGAFLKNEMIF